VVGARGGERGVDGIVDMEIGLEMSHVRVVEGTVTVTGGIVVESVMVLVDVTVVDGVDVEVNVTVGVCLCQHGLMWLMARPTDVTVCGIWTLRLNTL
jgi:hypothetical protein